jgi:FkbM family methyltransferase
VRVTLARKSGIRREYRNRSYNPFFLMSAAAFRDLARRAVPRGLRLWLRHPVQSSRWLWHAVRARAGGAVTLRMRADWDVRCHPAAVQAFEAERDQPDLRAELGAFVDLCRAGMILFDIGAHYGLFTLAAIHWGGAAARVVAVDPSAAALTVFDANMRLAGAGARVQRFGVAAGAEEGKTELLTGGAGAWQMMVPPDGPRRDAVAVPMVTLDALSARTGLVPTHVKIDVEGEEDAVLRGGERLLRRHAPIVFLELHAGILRRSARSPEQVVERLAQFGYRRFEIDGRAVTAPEAAALEVARIVCRT